MYRKKGKFGWRVRLGGKNVKEIPRSGKFMKNHLGQRRKGIWRKATKIRRRERLSARRGKRKIIKKIKRKTRKRQKHIKIKWKWNKEEEIA